MMSRPNRFTYTPITRGHKPTASQESNTLSTMSEVGQVVICQVKPTKQRYLEAPVRLILFLTPPIPGELCDNSLDGL